MQNKKAKLEILFNVFKGKWGNRPPGVSRSRLNLPYRNRLDRKWSLGYCEGWPWIHLRLNRSPLVAMPSQYLKAKERETRLALDSSHFEAF